MLISLVPGVRSVCDSLGYDCHQPMMSPSVFGALHTALPITGACVILHSVPSLGTTIFRKSVHTVFHSLEEKLRKPRNKTNCRSEKICVHILECLRRWEFF